MLALLNIGPFELLLLGAAAVLLFGGDLPDVARKAARMAGRLRAMTSDLTREFQGQSDISDIRAQLRRPAELDLPPAEKLLSQDPWRPAHRPPFDTPEGATSDANLEPTTTAKDEQPPTNPADASPELPAPQARQTHGDGLTEDEDPDDDLAKLD